MHKLILAVTAALLAGGAQAATFSQSTSAAGNAAAESSFLAAIGGSYDFTLDFETGYADEDRINGAVGLGGLSIAGIAQGGGNPKVEGGAGSIGGSNPIGNFALELADDGSFSGNVLELSFTGALSYLSFFVIDAAAQTVQTPTQSFPTSNTASSGNSALFVGLIFDPMETVSSVVVPYTGVGGSAGWAVDNISWGYQSTTPAVPLPAGLPLMLAGIGAFAALRRRR